MWKTDGVVSRIWREADHAYNLLTSGLPESIKEARAGIAAYRQSEPIWRALDVTDRIKRWINQDRGDHDAKDIAFLHAIRKDSWDNGDSIIGNDKWKYKARTARALFYCGRFGKARQRFGAVARLIGNPPPVNHRDAAYDAYAAQAEVEVYVGFPRRAITYLNRIPTKKQIGWREWVRAFALHQRGFEDRVGFGKASSPTDTMPGSSDWYVESNSILEAIQGDLQPVEQYDSHLLIAANFGALHRLGVSGAQKQAKDAFEVFKSAPHPSTNSTWSWVKEMRGRFPLRRLATDTGNHTSYAITTWRTAYSEHYHENLKVCGMPDLSLDDGDTDGFDEHDDDSGD